MSEDNIYFIWSIEHNGWWKPNKNGYTIEFNKAGQYTKEEAYKICANANWNSLSEIPVSSSFFKFQRSLHEDIRARKV